MLSEFLERQDLAALLTDAAPLALPRADALTAAQRAELEALAAEYRTQPYPMRKATDFLAFVREGSRQRDEAPYFARRRKLCAAVLDLSLLGNESALDDVADGLWCICEETSWVISAHNRNAIPDAPSPARRPLPEPDCIYIDLFAAQTGMILALTLAMAGEALDRLTPMLRRRAEREIRQRILLPFLDRDDYWWMGQTRKDLCNWTPWIVSNILLTGWLQPMARENRLSLTERCCRMLDRWLDVVPADGGCDEGVGYWNMAGGALLDCLETLERLTDGRMVFWTDEKLRGILRFPLRMEIAPGVFANFADCDARPPLSGERLQLAGEKLGDPALTAMGSCLRGSLADTLRDVPHFSRTLRMLTHPAVPAAVQAQPGDEWLPDLQVRMVRRGGFALCCKGGHNGESHNHNDVGSFILYLDGEPQIVEAGNMVYTAKTFSEERYSLWNIRSAYHSVPLIGGYEQRPGAAFAARSVSCLPDGLQVDLAGAYGPEAGAKAVLRTWRLSAGGLSLRDETVLASPKPVTWFFLLRNPPVLAPGTAAAGKLRIIYPAGLRASVEEIPVTDARMAKSWPGSLWRLSLEAEAADRQAPEFRFERND